MAMLACGLAGRLRLASDLAYRLNHGDCFRRSGYLVIHTSRPCWVGSSISRELARIRALANLVLPRPLIDEIAMLAGVSLSIGE